MSLGGFDVALFAGPHDGDSVVILKATAKQFGGYPPCVFLDRQSSGESPPGYSLAWDPSRPALYRLETPCEGRTRYRFAGIFLEAPVSQ